MQEWHMKFMFNESSALNDLLQWMLKVESPLCNYWWMKSYLGFGTRCKLCHMAMLVLGFLFWFIIESLWDTIIIGIPTFIVFV